MTRRLVFLLGALALLPTASRADTMPAAGMGGAFLAVPQGPRGVALGEANTALSDDTEAVAWNPGGLGLTVLPSIRLSHMEWLAGMRLETVSGVLGLGSGSLGASAAALLVPAVTQRDATGELLGGTASASEYVVRTGYGRPLGKTFGAGAAVTVLSETLAGRQILALAGSAGGLWVPSPKWRFGAYLSNIGTAAAGFPLPLTASLGAAYAPGSGNLVLSGDGRFVSNGGPNYGVGAEYQVIANTLFVRAGYRAGAPASPLGPVAGLRAGFGYRFDLRGTLGELDYAVASYGELGLTHRVALGLAWPPTKVVEQRVRPEALSPPARVGVSAEGGQLLVRWDAVPGAAGYNVYVASPGSSMRKVNNKPWTNTDLRIRGAASRELLVSITAVDKDGTEGLPSAPAGYVPVVPTSTPKPTLAPTRTEHAAPTPAPRTFGPPLQVAEKVLANEVQLAWEAVPDAVGYNVYIALSDPSAGGEYEKATEQPIPTTEFTYPAPGGTTLYFAVSSVNHAGKESARTAATVGPLKLHPTPAAAESKPAPTRAPASTEPKPAPTPKPKTFGAPTSVKATGLPNQISLSWEAVPDAKGYNVYVSFADPKDGGQYDKATANPIPATEFTQPAPGGTTLYFVVTAVDGSGKESARSKDVSATAK